MFALFNNITDDQREHAIEEMIRQSSPRFDFFLMVALAVAMASFGVVLDDTVVLIGSMLIAPVLSPVLALALGVVIAGPTLIGRSFVTIVIAVLSALATGFVIGTVFHPIVTHDNGVLTSMAEGAPSIGVMFVATISGLAAAFGVMKQNLSGMLPGVSVSVSLVPPLATAGVAISRMNWSIAMNAFLIFLINVVCIILAAIVIFSLFRLGSKRKMTRATVKKDVQEVHAERKAAGF